MRKSLFAPGAALLALLAGCAGMGPERETKGAAAPPEILQIPLKATIYNAGRIGSAILVSRGDETAITLQVSNVPASVTRPVHLHAYVHQGGCGAMAPQPAYDLTGHALAGSITRPTAIAAFRGPFAVTGVAPVSLEKLRETPHAIDVRTSPADGDVSIFCGNITG